MSTLVAFTPTGPASGTLHLTQILVSYEDAVRLLRIRDAYDWHQRVWQAFGGRESQTRDFLIRVDRKEEAYRVLILSHSLPAKPDWCPTDCFGTKVIPDNYFSGVQTVTINDNVALLLTILMKTASVHSLMIRSKKL